MILGVKKNKCFKNNVHYPREHLHGTSHFKINVVKTVTNFYRLSPPPPPPKYMLSVAKIGRHVADFFVSHHVVKL